MKIRLANLESDALSIMDGAKDFYKRTGVESLFPTDDQEFMKAISRIMVLEDLTILLAEQEKQVVGGIGILYAPFLWNPSITVGDELFWWTDRNAPFRTGIYLFDEAMKQIKEKGAIPIFRSMETSPKGVERLYHRRGLRRIETTHIGIP